MKLTVEDIDTLRHWYGVAEDGNYTDSECGVLFDKLCDIRAELTGLRDYKANIIRREYLKESISLPKWRTMDYMDLRNLEARIRSQDYKLTLLIF